MIDEIPPARPIEFGQPRPFLCKMTADRIREMNIHRCSICGSRLHDRATNVCQVCLRAGAAVADKE